MLLRIVCCPLAVAAVGVPDDCVDVGGDVVDGVRIVNVVGTAVDGVVVDGVADVG